MVDFEWNEKWSYHSYLDQYKHKQIGRASVLNNKNSTMERAIFAFLRVLMLPEMKLREISELEEK